MPLDMDIITALIAIMLFCHLFCICDVKPKPEPDFCNKNKKRNIMFTTFMIEEGL